MKNNIPIITLAGLSILILSMFSFYVQPALALSFADITLTTANTKCTDKGTSVYYFVVEACQGGNGGTVALERYSYSSNALVNTVNVKSLRGNLTSGITTVASGNDGTVGAIRCVGNYCWVARTGTVQYQLQKWNIVTGLPVNYLNFSVSGNLRLAHKALAISNNEIWSAVQCSADTTQYQATAWDTTDSITQTKQIGICASSTNTMSSGGNSNVDVCYDCGGTAGVNRVAFGVQNSAGGNVIHIFDAVALTRKCASSLSSATTTNTRGVIAYMGNSINKWGVPTDSNTVLIVTQDTCVINTTITSTELGTPANHIKGIDVNVHNGEYMVYHSSTTLAKVAVMDLTSLVNLHNLIITVSGVGSGMESNSFFATDSNTLVLKNKVFLTTTSTTARMWTLDQTSTGDSNEEEDNQQAGFCGNGTLRDCLGDRSALSGLVPANENITSIATTIGQGIGLIDPNNENPRTNGTGLFLMLITGTFFAIALMSTVHTLNMRGYISASVKEIDPIFWLFLVVGVVSVAWYLDWIDDIIFASMTVGLAGLIAFGVLKHFGRI